MIFYRFLQMIKLNFEKNEYIYISYLYKYRKNFLNLKS